MTLEQGIPFEPLIKGVPEEALTKREISSEPTRIPIRAVLQTTGYDTLYKVPEGKILEVIFINNSFTTISTSSDISRFRMRTIPPTQLLFETVISGNQTVSDNYNFPKSGFLLDENQEITLDVDLQGTYAEWICTLIGNLIPKSEASTKLNILI